jgi:hypothetical protein
VYAYPTHEGGQLRVVAAWVAPGKTTFTCDGPLPSDHAGRLFSIAAVLAMLAVVAVWSRARWRQRALRAMLRGLRRMPAVRRRAIQIGVPVVFLVLVVRGCRDRSGKTMGLELGSGLRPTAIVEARKSGDTAWERCGYERLVGRYDCDGLVTAWDGTAALINDAPPSWAFVTPAITAAAYHTGVEIRVTLETRLSGRYIAASSEYGTMMSVAGAAPFRVASTEAHSFTDGKRTVEVTGPVPINGWQLTFVRNDTLEPPRQFLADPPKTAPAAVLALTARK